MNSSKNKVVAATAGDTSIVARLSRLKSELHLKRSVLWLRTFAAKGEGAKPQGFDQYPHSFEFNTVTEQLYTFSKGHRVPCDYAVLSDLNKSQGVYVVVNPGIANPDTHGDAAIIEASHLFFECDDLDDFADQHKAIDVAEQRLGVKFTRIETSKSIHAYLTLDAPLAADKFTAHQKTLFAYMDAIYAELGFNVTVDHSLSNRSRVMRVPGFNHVGYQDGQAIYKPVKIVATAPKQALPAELVPAEQPKARTTSNIPPAASAKPKGSVKYDDESNIPIPVIFFGDGDKYKPCPELQNDVQISPRDPNAKSWRFQCPWCEEHHGNGNHGTDHIELYPSGHHAVYCKEHHEWVDDVVDDSSYKYNKKLYGYLIQKRRGYLPNNTPDRSDRSTVSNKSDRGGTRPGPKGGAVTVANFHRHLKKRKVSERVTWALNSLKRADSPDAVFPLVMAYLNKLRVLGLPNTVFIQMLTDAIAPVEIDESKAMDKISALIALDNVPDPDHPCQGTDLWKLFHCHFQSNLKVNERSGKYRLDGALARLEDLRYDFIVDTGHEVGGQKFLEELSTWANRHHKHDPFIDLLETMGTVPAAAAEAVLGNLFKVMGLATDIERTMVRKWLLAAVERAFEPGKGQPPCLVIKGEGGSGKSSFFAALGGVIDEGYCSVDALSASGFGNDEKIKAQASLLMELAEIDQCTSKTGLAAIKQYMTESSDNFRRPYARCGHDTPRRFVIGATCNHMQPLTDDGAQNRRYIVIHVPGGEEQGRVRKAYYSEHAPAIWQAIYSLYRAGELSEFTVEQRQEVKTARAQEVVRSLVYDRIIDGLPQLTEEFYRSPGKKVYGLHLEQIHELFADDPNKLSGSAKADIKSALAECGWITKQIRRNGKARRVWVPGHIESSEIEGMAVSKVLRTYAESIPDYIGDGIAVKMRIDTLGLY